MVLVRSTAIRVTRESLTSNLGRIDAPAIVGNDIEGELGTSVPPTRWKVGEIDDAAHQRFDERRMACDVEVPTPARPTLCRREMSLPPICPPWIGGTISVVVIPRRRQDE